MLHAVWGTALIQRLCLQLSFGFAELQSAN